MHDIMHIATVCSRNQTDDYLLVVGVLLVSCENPTNIYVNRVKTIVFLKVHTTDDQKDCETDIFD